MSGSRWAHALEGKVLAGRYSIDRIIGEGGMGAVFAGTQLAVQRRVAVKVLSPHVSDNASVLDRFHREAVLVAKIARRGVPEVIDFDRDAEAGPFLVMDLLEGESLADRLRRRERLEPREAAAIGAEVLETLEVVHAEGIVHRDLKPANVFLAQEAGKGRVVKVLDFGVARVATPSAEATSHGTVLGTPRYMAPEQALSDPAVDARADLYAVGAVLYACVSGKPPYAGLSGEAVLAAVRERPLQPLGEVCPGLPPQLVALVDKATARAPGDRFQSAAQMRRALAAVVAELPEAAPPSSIPSARGPVSGQPTLRERTAPLAPAPPAVERTAPLAAPRPEATPSPEALPATRTPGRSSRRVRRMQTGLPVLALAALAALALVGIPAVRNALRGNAPATTPGASAAPSSSAAPANAAELAQARAALRAGDTTRARALLEQIVRDAELSGLRGPSPAARVVGEAVLLLGDLDARALALPPPLDPDSLTGVGVVNFVPVMKDSQRPLDRYIRVGTWGAFDQMVCGQRRAGLLAERLVALATSMEARDLATLRKRPDAAVFQVVDERGLRDQWSSTIRAYRANAKAYYEGAISTARMVDGPSVDPVDGVECRADAFARRDAIDALADAGP
jgi:serine/threonine-protein kinase